MSTAARDLRHTLRNAVNHIVGYADLLAEEAADVDPAGPLAGALAEVAGAAQDVLAETARLEGSGGPARGGPDAAMADLEPALARVAALASAMTGRAGLDGDTARALGHIVDAAGRARSLVAGAGVEEPPTTDGRGARIDLATAAPPRTTPVRPGGGSVVLVVDDDEANRDVLARRLARLGYQVRQAPDGRAALASMRRDPVDLVLLDIDMPELDGYGVLEARQADAALREVPAIIISASADIHSVVRCIGMGAEDHLQKPFDPVLLEARLGACLEKKRLRDQERQLLATVSHQAAELAELNATLEARVAAQVDELGRAARLRRFLSPPLADAIVSGGDETVLAIHRRDIAVLFVDLCGFTAFAETAEPEDVMAVLREFHDELGQLVADYAATVGFFAGDGLMVFFNDPLPCPDPAGQAVRMGVEMRQRLAPRVAAWRRRGHDVGFAIGIASGYATLGEIGFEGRYDYGVIGSVVNLAARLCDRAERGQILVSARAKLAVDDTVEIEDLGPASLHGFHAPVAVYAVVGLRQ